MPDENLIRLVDKLLEAAVDANRELDDAISTLYDLDATKTWDGWIISSDGPMTLLSAELHYLRDELDKLSIDLRTIGEPR
jgi:hypothetical protein